MMTSGNQQGHSTPLAPPVHGRRIRLFADAAAVGRAAEALLTREIRLATMAGGSASRREFHLVLSGGSTPRALYQAVLDRATKDERTAELYRHVHYWHGDERCVPVDSADSNTGDAVRRLLDPLGVGADYRHFPNGGAEDLVSEAKRMTREVRNAVSKTATHPTAPSAFDLVFLGMGDDGHTASLFPGTAALADESFGYVVNDVPQLNTRRLTLTFPMLNAARHVVILCAGEKKAPVLREVLNVTKKALAAYPVTRVQPEHLTWLVDEAAAGELTEEERSALSMQSGLH